MRRKPAGSARAPDLDNPAALADADQHARQSIAELRARIRASAVVPLAAVGVLACGLVLARRLFRH